MKSIRFLALAASVLLSTAGSAQQLDAAVDETPRAWFVELSSPPTIEGTALSATKAEKQAFRNAAKQAGLSFKERFAFDTLFNGVSISIDRAQLNTLRQIDGVKNVWPVHTYSIPPVTEVSNPDLISAITMTGVDIAHDALGLTGAGVKVAVMDTGVDYKHPDLGGCFGPGCRVAYGTDLVGDDYDANDAEPVIKPDPDPMDCAGHGSHVAGIVGARAASASGVTGVAPGVTFGAYRVFGCKGSTSDEIMIRAMELALADGMQVLNMSIGDAFSWAQSPTAVASNRLVNHGMTVVASIGNSGASGLYSAGAPGLGEKVIGVASFDNIQLNGVNSFVVDPDGRHVGYLPGGALTGGANPPVPPLSGSAELVRTGTTTTTNDACNGAPTKPAPGSLTGKIALIRRGTCAFSEKVQNAETAGAVAVVLYNNANAPLNAGISNPTYTPKIPTAGINAADGAGLNSLLAAGAVTLTWTTDLVNIPNPGNIISSFSSYGLAPDLTLKPDIGAPGGFIRSTWPLALGGYANLSGTSMASPHVAGAVALYLQAHPGTRPESIRAILQNTAEPKNWFGAPTAGLIENVHRQGAGMLRIDRAVVATAAVTPSKLSLGESQAGPSTQTLTVTNGGDDPVTYALSHQAALATGPNTFSVGFFLAPAGVSFSATSVTVPAHGSATVTATIAAPADANLADKGIYGGYIVFTPTDEGQKLRVPFAGFKGDYQSIQVITDVTGETPALPSLPLVARDLGAGKFEPVAAGTTFNLAKAEFPNFLVHLHHQARILRMEVFDAQTGRAWHRADNESYARRNSAASSFFAIPWDGVTIIGNKNGAKGVLVPDGSYVMKISVLKALGDESNPADWESWTSPAFSIKR